VSHNTPVPFVSKVSVPEEMKKLKGNWLTHIDQTVLGDIGVLWPNGWMNQDATWYRGD